MSELGATGSGSRTEVFPSRSGSGLGNSGPGTGQGSAVDQAKEQATQAVDTAKEQATQAVDMAKEKAGQVAEQVSTTADAGLDKAAGGLDKAADVLRERGQAMGGGGAMQGAATEVADRLDVASGYLKDKDSQQLMSDLEDLVRRKPTQTLLVAAGVGFVLSKVLR